MNTAVATDGAINTHRKGGAIICENWGIAIEPGWVSV